ncbi:uncharacterized protein JCM6883_007526 [Sporobolomyces salmoneus]|uniref:uncharacterized protein n=1 Tax=Sporobolomyces salmoneus TaxID=183962 RepID=UPI003171C0B7
MARDKKLTRSLSRPFTDLTDLLRSPSTSSTKDRKKQKQDRARVPRSTFREDFSLPPSPTYASDSNTLFTNTDNRDITFESVPAPPNPSTLSIPSSEPEEQFEYLSDPSPLPDRSTPSAIITTDRWRIRECSPVLEEDSEQEMSSFFSAHPHLDLVSNGVEIPSTEEGGDEAGVDESFVTARETDEGGFLQSLAGLPRETIKEEEEEIVPVKEEGEIQQERTYRSESEGEDTEQSQDSTVSTSFASSSGRFSNSGGPDASTTIDTPDSSFPSTPGDHDDGDVSGSNWLFTPSKSKQLSTVVASSSSSSTPPPQARPPRFVEVVETCPTPEHQTTGVEATREEETTQGGELNETVASPLRNRSCAGDRDEEVRRRRSLLRSWELTDDQDEEQFNREAEELAKGFQYVSPTSSHLDLHRSYAPSLVNEPDFLPASGSIPATPRQHRSRQSTRNDLFPTISATDLVASLLSSPTHPSSYRLPSSSRSKYYDPSLSHPHPHPRSHSPVRRPTRPLSHPHSKTLLPQSSSSTLFTYDLSHLPAPKTPLEEPYRVRFWDVLKPSGYLGGGKGSGKYGDRFGAVERKTPRSTRVRRSGSSLWGISEDETMNEGRRVDTPIPELGGGKMRRSGSLRRSLSRWTNRLSLTGIETINEDEAKRTTMKRSQSIRRGLSTSLSGLTLSGGGRRRREEEREREKLEQWVSVVVA